MDDQTMGHSAVLSAWVMDRPPQGSRSAVQVLSGPTHHAWMRGATALGVDHPRVNRRDDLEVRDVAVRGTCRLVDHGESVTTQLFPESALDH
eukprot:6974160-Alexandrium_andersonii.AAC.1